MSAKPSYEDRADDGDLELTPEEVEADFDLEATQRLGISAAEFRRRWNAGDYAHLRPDDDRDVWLLSFYVGGWRPAT